MTRLEASRPSLIAARVDAARTVAPAGAGFQAVLDAMLPSPDSAAVASPLRAPAPGPDPGSPANGNDAAPAPVAQPIPGDADGEPGYLVDHHVPVVEIPVEHDDRGKRATLLPWGLQAHAGLSYVATPAADAEFVVGPSIEGERIDRPEGASSATQAHAPDAAPRASGSMVGAAPPPVAAQFAVAQPARRAAHDAVAIAASDPPSPLPDSEPFSARHLQWQVDADGVTAFARDYRIAPDAIPALVQSIRSAANALPAPLRRIVVNGREAWRAVLSTRPKGT